MPAPPLVLPVPVLGDRSLFPDLQPRVYLNHAAVSPASAPVKAAAQAVLDDVARRGVGATLDWVEQRVRLKARLARLINADATDVALCSNTTRGLSDIALCLPWEQGERVVVFRGEFPANVTPWQRAAAEHGLEIVMLEADEYRCDEEAALARLTVELQRGVRLVAVSLVQFQTGLRMPVERMAALCHAHGAAIAVDAIQGLGAVPFDARAADVDYLSCGSHKWLMGLEGAAFVYVKPERVAALRPVVAGWLSHEQPLRFLFEGAGHLRYDRPIKQSADFLEGGAQNAVGFAALEASVGLIDQLTPARIFDHVSAILDRLEAPLVDFGYESLRSPRASQRSAMLCVRPPPGVDVIALHARLGEAGIACSIPDGVLRFAPHFPNALHEVDDVLRAITSA